VVVPLPREAGAQLLHLGWVVGSPTAHLQTALVAAVPALEAGIVVFEVLVFSPAEDV
jgi:hypothetical protein